MRHLRVLLATLAALFALALLATPAWAGEEPASDEETSTEDEVTEAGEAEAGGEGEESEFSDEETEEAIHHAEEIAEANGAEHADAECIPILVRGGTIDDCREAPNPLLPETNEIIWGSLGFVVVFGFLTWKGYPAMKKAMADRADRIKADLDAAERARTEAETEKSNYLASLSGAKSEAAAIIEEARKQADQLKVDAQARLNDELAAARTQAQADIEAAKGQAMAELRGEVTSIAIGAAEAVVQRALDRDAQIQLIEDYINQVQR